MSSKNRGLRFVFHCFILLSLYPVMGWGQSVNRLPDGNIVRWNTPTVEMIVDVRSFQNSPVRNPVRQVAIAARSWRIANPHVPRFQIRLGRSGPIGYQKDSDDNHNNVIFYRERFPVIDGRQVLALTLLTRNSATGEIVDADIIFDGQHHSFATLSGSMLGVPNAPHDFLNVLTHEFGHVLGLVEDHTNPDATMFYSSQPGEIGKADLSGPDIRSITETYANEPAHTRRQLSLPSVDTVITALSLLISLPAIVIGLYALFFRKNRSAAITTAHYAASALLLTLGYPNVHPTTTEHGLVVSSRSFWNRGVMHTVATVQTAHGLECVTRLGGRIGNYEQQVLDAPSGHQFKRGTRVPVNN